MGAMEEQKNEDEKNEGHNGNLKKLEKKYWNEKILLAIIGLLVLGFLGVNNNWIPNPFIPQAHSVPSTTIQVTDSASSCIDSIEAEGKTFQVEIADTHEKQVQGLMFRKYLPQDYGMLFVFSHAFKYSFWMENMEFPLDIVYISPESKVIQVFEAEPCTNESCPTVQPTEDAKYVLEINRGISKTAGIHPGTSIKMQLCPQNNQSI